MVSRRHRESPALLYILLGLAALIAWTESASGHASDKGDFTVSELTDRLHLLGATVWGGGLFVLSLIILPHLNKRGTEALPSIAGVVAGLRRIAGRAVGIIALTSLHHAWVYVGSVEALEEERLTATLSWQTRTFFPVIGTCLIQSLSLCAFLQSQAGLPSPGHKFADRFFTSWPLRPLPRRLKSRMTVSWLLRSMRTEAALMLVVLLCVSLLRDEIPASRSVSASRHRLSRGWLHPCERQPPSQRR